MQQEGQVSRAGYLKERFRCFHLRDTAGQELDYHFHEFDKLVLLLSGRVDYMVEGNRYALEPWTVLLVKHHTIHRALIDRTVPYERIIVYLDGGYFGGLMPEAELLHSFDLADRRGEHLLRPTPPQREELERLLALCEREDREYGAAALRETYILQLLILLGRMAAVVSDPGESRMDPKIQQTLSYINENLHDPLGVEQLAEQVYLSKYHFMRLFKAQTGSTVHGYIRQKRLLQAARLLREGRPAAQAAADSGFGDYSTFHRAFRECFGVNPSALKNT